MNPAGFPVLALVPEQEKVEAVDEDCLVAEVLEDPRDRRTVSVSSTFSIVQLVLPDYVSVVSNNLTFMRYTILKCNALYQLRTPVLGVYFWLHKKA